MLVYSPAVESNPTHFHLEHDERAKHRTFQLDSEHESAEQESEHDTEIAMLEGLVLVGYTAILVLIGVVVVLIGVICYASNHFSSWQKKAYGKNINNV